MQLTNFEATAQAAQAIRGSILLKMAIIQNATLASVVVGGRVDVDPLAIWHQLGPPVRGHQTRLMLLV